MAIKSGMFIVPLLILACGPMRGERQSDDPKIVKEAEGTKRCKTEEGKPYNLTTDSCVTASKEVCDEWKMTFDEINMRCVFNKLKKWPRASN